VLSQKFRDKDLYGFQNHPVTFDEADDHLNMRKHRLIRFDLNAVSPVARRSGDVLYPISSLVQCYLFLLALLATIICNASFCGFLPAVGFSTSKRTSKIVSACIARVGEKQDLTVSAAGQTAL
jgi:predicted Kef-type K+ transport protein